MAVEPTLIASNISLDINDKTILRDISLQLQSGRILGVLGPNGAGKTSLLKCLSGQVDFTGMLKWNDHDVRMLDSKSRAQQIAVVNQMNDNVFALTLAQVVQMGLLPHKPLFSLGSRADEEKVNAAISSVGLRDKRASPFNELSGGEQQRCLIARALVQEAQLMVLDEPVNHLDVYYQHQILQLLRSLCHSQQKTAVVSLHDLNLAANYCEYLLLLNRGKCIAFGETKSVLNPSLLSDVFRVPCQVNQSKTGLIQVHFEPSFQAAQGQSKHEI
ncbi:ABC transporter ATP-binding protein [Agaribacter flavus]|uniref:ABC transporter ATP-binding protein n=1 Tax=Agaribacter flavus TaxID=1902781 RepID=A0ABV7FVP3_9ALTE